MKVYYIKLADQSTTKSNRKIGVPVEPLGLYEKKKMIIKKKI
jgi:hypothetical protein